MTRESLQIKSQLSLTNYRPYSEYVFFHDFYVLVHDSWNLINVAVEIGITELESFSYLFIVAVVVWLKL